MLNNTLGILVTILLLFSACKDEEPPISSTKELLNFSILKSDNQGKVANDVEASIQGSVITLPLDKYDDLKSLIAVFEYNGKSITINGVEQESGVTSNDYSQPLVFTVEAEDGSKQQYTVEIALKDTGVLSCTEGCGAYCGCGGTWCCTGLCGGRIEGCCGCPAMGLGA